MLPRTLFSEAPARRRRTLGEAWSELWETDPPVYPLRLGPGAPWPKARGFTPALLASTFIHGSLTFFLYSIPFAIIISWFLGPPERVAPHHLVVVKLDHLNLADYLPVIKPPGQAKAPGRGAKPGKRPRLGATHYDPRITIISNPPHPDNSRLTLKNENAPPSPIPLKDLKVPDLISGGPAPIPEVAKSPTPPAPQKVENSTPEPPKPAPPPKPPEMQPFVPTVKPVLTLPPPPPPQLALAMKLPDIPAPKLEVPLPPPPPKTPPPAAEPSPAPPQPTPQDTTRPAGTGAGAPLPNNRSDAAAPGDTVKPGGGPKILSLSVDPVPLTDISKIPGGVHEGAFSISPAGGGGVGSPGGVPGGGADVGEGGHGPGGDKSVAVGNGTGTPGGGGHGGPTASPYTSPSISVSGTGGSSGVSAGTLAPLKAEDLVYPVKPETPKARAPSIVVSSGSSGGGGLRIYGVLHGDRIYTVYFSMPGKSWILQYCAHESIPKVDGATRTVQIHIPPPLAPPAVIEQYDYHRPTAAPDPSNSTIILHGFIHEDGAISDLTVLQGLDAISNSAATLAFSRWKFKPAMRAGAPVAIEILVGIP